MSTYLFITYLDIILYSSVLPTTFMLIYLCIRLSVEQKQKFTCLMISCDMFAFGWSPICSLVSKRADAANTMINDCSICSRPGRTPDVRADAPTRPVMPAWSYHHSGSKFASFVDDFRNKTMVCIGHGNRRKIVYSGFIFSMQLIYNTQSDYDRMECILKILILKHLSI